MGDHDDLDLIILPDEARVGLDRESMRIGGLELHDTGATLKMRGVAEVFLTRSSV